MAGIVRVFDNRPRGYVLDLTDLSNGTFYPVIMNRHPGGMNYNGLAGLDCEIHSPSYGAAAAYNQNYITFRAQCDGWGDEKEMLTVREYGCYDANEITIGCIGFGSKDGPVCVWVRGGLKYGFYCNSIPELHTSAYTTASGEVFTPGSNYYGGTNTNVNIQWTPNGETMNTQLMAWPVGSIFMSTIHDTAAKVQAAVGGGTWVSYGAGRVPVGVDSAQTEFNTVGKTGGSKNGSINIEDKLHYGDGSYSLASGAGAYSDRFVVGVGGRSGDAEQNYHPFNNIQHTTLQPYITCYMWKRTA